MKKLLSLTAILLCAALLNDLVGHRNSTLKVSAADVLVIDGDTIDHGDNSYRLIGFDTPETYRAQCAEERALGLKAKDRLTELIESAGGLELDVQKHRDKYQRLLARAYADGQDVGDILISEGLARPYSGGKRQPWCT